MTLPQGMDLSADSQGIDMDFSPAKIKEGCAAGSSDAAKRQWYRNMASF
jgi:hypothetical protein